MKNKLMWVLPLMAIPMASWGAAAAATNPYNQVKNSIQQEAGQTYIPNPGSIWPTTCAATTNYLCSIPADNWQPGAVVAGSSLPVVSDADDSTGTGGTINFNYNF